MLVWEIVGFWDCLSKEPLAEQIVVLDAVDILVNNERRGLGESQRQMPQVTDQRVELLRIRDQPAELGT